MEQAKRLPGLRPSANCSPTGWKRQGYHHGNEVYSGRIADAFTPVVEKKLAQYGMRMEAHVTLGDGKQEIAEAIRRMKAEGC